MQVFLGECCAAFLSNHGSDECGPLFLGESLQPAQACPEADVADVALGVVLGGRCPSADDVADADGVVLACVGAQDAECGA